MKTKIIIGILVITNITMMLFAFAQKVAADEQRELAELSAIEAQRQAEIALAQSRMAQENAEEASRMAEVANKEINRLQDELTACK